MQFLTQALADRRALISAALTGSGLSMAIAAAFMAGGLGRAADAELAERAVTPAQISGLLDDGVRADDNAIDRNPRLVALDRDRELNCLTQAVYFEARGESAQGQQAVAQVVLNRVKARGFPKTVCGVVYQGAVSRDCQFSFACDGSTRRGREGGAWDRARKVATRAMSGAVMAEVGGATHFHTTGVSPGWAGMTRVAQVGLHVFYRPGGGAIVPRQAVAEKAIMTGLTASAVVAVAPSMQMAASLAAETKPAQPAPKAADAAAAGVEVSAVKTAETATF